MGEFALEGTCHCGKVSWTLRSMPESVTACNCTSCRRWGGLWAYGAEKDDVATRGATTTYVRGENLEYHFCDTCACVTHWRTLRPGKTGKHAMAVNLRMAEPDLIADLPVDHFEGLMSFEDEPRDSRCVRDYWY